MIFFVFLQIFVPRSEGPPLILYTKNLIFQKLNIPFADYGSMQHFVEKSQIHSPRKTNATPRRKCLFSLKCYLSFNPY